MAISKENKKVIELPAYRRKPVPYEIDSGPGLISSALIEELVREGKWLGTYSPPPPYGLQKENDEDENR